MNNDMRVPAIPSKYEIQMSRTKSKMALEADMRTQFKIAVKAYFTKRTIEELMFCLPECDPKYKLQQFINTQVREGRWK